MRAVLISVSKAPSRQFAADASPAIWDHTVLPATRYGRTRPCLIYGRRAKPPHITAITFPICTNLYCLVNRGTCVNNLPKVVTWQCCGSGSNLRPQGYKFGTLYLVYTIE